MFLCGQWIRILSISMTPSPHPLTSSLRPLNSATSHNNDNNNGGLLLVFVFLATYSPCSRVWVTAAVQIYYWSTQTILVSLQWTFLSSSCCVWFLLLLSVCLSVHKLYAHALSLLLRFWLISSATYRPGIWTTVFWVVFSWYSVANVLEMTQRKTEEKDHFGTCGQGQRMNVASLYTVTNTVKNCSTITSCYGKFGCSYLVNCSSVINSLICFNENDLVNLLCCYV